MYFESVRQLSVPVSGPPLTHLVVMKAACAVTTLRLLHKRANAFLHVPGRETHRSVAIGGQRPRPIQEPPFLRAGAATGLRFLIDTGTEIRVLPSSRVIGAKHQASLFKQRIYIYTTNKNTIVVE